MKSAHVIVIGAGISGLITARELLKKNFRVTLLEAQNRIGGRIHTTHTHDEKLAIEKGAEFIHGKLPATFALVKQYGLKVKKAGGRMISFNSVQHDHESRGWELMIHKMEALQNDMPFAGFLNTFFGDEKYAQLRNSAKQFAGGFDLADPETASTIALSKEWSKDEGDQFRIEGGYKMLINALGDDCIRLGGTLFTSENVTEINWKENEVKVITETKNKFSGNGVVITVSAGIMQLHSGEKNYIRFSPEIKEQRTAFTQIGFGKVIKILLHFKKPFWNEYYENAGFLLTGGMVPTWWTQAPEESNILTGWVGAAAATSLKEKYAHDITGASIRSLADAFGIKAERLKSLLISSTVVDWGTDQYTLGGYSFSTTKTEDAKKKLNEPVGNVLFFAGEALDNSSMPGTVEAAICNGFACAEKIIATFP